MKQDTKDNAVHNSGMKQHNIVIIGCGDIGIALGQRLHARGQNVYGVRRRSEKLPQFIKGVDADFTHAAELKHQLAQLAADYVIVTLTPAGFTAAAYEQCFGDGTRNILAALSSAPPQRLLYVSSTGVYHQTDGEWVDEESATQPQQFNGEHILAAEKQVLSAAMPATIVRCGGIYGPGRLRLIQNLQQNGTITASKNFSNRIHRDDCAAMLEHLLLLDAGGDSVADCYLGVDSEPAPLQEVQRYIAHCLGITPTLAAAAHSQRSSNKRCSNQRIVASGFEFTYPDYRAGYEALLRAEGLI